MEKFTLIGNSRLEKDEIKYVWLRENICSDDYLWIERVGAHHSAQRSIALSEPISYLCYNLI